MLLSHKRQVKVRLARTDAVSVGIAFIMKFTEDIENINFINPQ